MVGRHEAAGKSKGLVNGTGSAQKPLSKPLVIFYLEFSRTEGDFKPCCFPGICRLLIGTERWSG